MRPSAILPLEGTADGPTKKSHTVKYLKVMTASCQITCAIPWLPCEQLPYPPEYPRVSRMRQKISQICPCPFCPINTSFSGTPSPSHHSTAPTLLSWQQRCSIAPRTTARSSSNNPQDFDLLPRGAMAVNFVIPEVSLPSFFFVLLLYFGPSTIPFTEYSPFFSFYFFFYPYNL